ncbi:MAG: hypothetical protein C4320_06960, partial [Armatimonadota bacterium]
MAVELTPFGKFVKWIAFPFALAAVGAYVIGPRVGAGHIGAIERIASRFRRPGPPVVAPETAAGVPKPTGSHRAGEFQDVRRAPISPPANSRSGPEASAAPVAPVKKPSRRAQVDP